MSRESVLAYLGEDWDRVKALIRSHQTADEGQADLPAVSMAGEDDVSPCFGIILDQLRFM